MLNFIYIKVKLKHLYIVIRDFRILLNSKSRLRYFATGCTIDLHKIKSGLHNLESVSK